ncbi:MAG TPA: WYL domain-containing protein [Ignavibacteria bacterium]
MNYIKMYDNIRFIDKELKKGNYPNASYLCKRLGWKDRKTIFRLIQIMKEELGAPIEYNENKKGYYYTDNNFILVNSFITKREIVVLKIIENFVKDEFGEEFYNSFNNLVNRIMPPDYDRNESEFIKEIESSFSFQPDPRTNIKVDILLTLIDAIYFEEKTKILYRSQKGETLERIIHPYRIIYKNGGWYVIAFCELRNNTQFFAIHNIISIQLLEEKTFTKPDKIDIKIGHGIDSLSGHGNYEVIIKILPSSAEYVRHRFWHNSQKITENNDGSILISFQLNTLNNIKRWVLGLGENAIVVSPTELIDLVKKEATNILKCYI